MRDRTKFYLVVIADYNDGDAHGIVHDNLFYWFGAHDLDILEYDRVNVRPFNTVHTGYMLARRALNPLSPSERQVFFVNTAPRFDDSGKRAANQGEGFVLAELKNGKRVFAVNSGHSLSFIKPAIERLRPFNIPDDVTAIPMLLDALHGSGNVGAGQFRSGYIYPIATALALSGADDPLSSAFDTLMGADMDPAVLPDIPDGTLVFRDGYGNLKTSVEPAALDGHYDGFAVVACGETEIIAHVSRGMFAVPLHHFSFAPGSTILDYGGGAKRQFVEIALRGGHAARAFTTVIGTGERFLPLESAPVSWRPAAESDFGRLGYAADGAPPAAVLEAALRL